MSLLVRCGQLFDGTGAATRPNATLMIEDGLITDRPLGEGAETLDLGSLFVMPGLVDAHSHVSIVLADGDQWEQKRQDATAQALRAPHNLGLDVRGLMTVAAPDPTAAGESFGSLGRLADRLGLEERSMGMSDDLEAAVAAGSTMVRIGRALFGARPPVATR